MAVQFNMEMSFLKISSMTKGKYPILYNLAVENETIEQVMNFNYLGIMLLSNRNIYEETSMNNKDENAQIDSWSNPLGHETEFEYQTNLLSDGRCIHWVRRGIHE